MDWNWRWYRICKIMQLAAGFSETKQEFSRYYQNMRKKVLRSSISELKDIRHHNLKLLLYYSGKEIFVTTELALEWDRVSNWRPEIRYLDDVVRKKRAAEFLRSIEAILVKYYLINFETMLKKSLHVIPFGAGWAVLPAGAKRATVITTKQSEAISYARNIAKNASIELIVHGRDGKIRERSSYGNDPIRTKG